MIENQTQDQVQTIAYSGIDSDIPDLTKISPQQRTSFLLRLFASNADNVSDCELLSLIIATAAPQADSHVLAIRLLEHFGDVTTALCAEIHSLKTIEGIDDAILQAFGIMRLMVQRMAKTSIMDQPVIQSWAALMDYCQLKIGHNHVEEFHVLYLNHRHALIADEKMQHGTMNHTPVYPREIVKRALELSASGVILFHNHPSGDPTPSKSDIDVTIKIVEAGATMNITVFDHVIVTKTGTYSFKKFDLL